MNQVLINIDKWIIYKRITCLVPVYLLNTKKEWAKQSRKTNITVLEFTVGWANMLQRNSSFLHSRLYSHFVNTTFILDQGLLFFEGYEFPTNEFACPDTFIFQEVVVFDSRERSCYSSVLWWGIRWMEGLNQKIDSSEASETNFW